MDAQKWWELSRTCVWCWSCSWRWSALTRTCAQGIVRARNEFLNQTEQCALKTFKSFVRSALPVFPWTLERTYDTVEFLFRVLVLIGSIRCIKWDFKSKNLNIRDKHANATMSWQKNGIFLLFWMPNLFFFLIFDAKRLVPSADFSSTAQLDLCQEQFLSI